MKIRTLLGVALLSAVLTSCYTNEHGTVDLTAKPAEPISEEYVYNHPCAMYSQADFDRVKTSLDESSAPQAVKDEFQSLKGNTYAMLPYTANPQTQIVRGDVTGTDYTSENYVYAMRDAAAAYQQAILWKLTGDDSYAASAVTILNAWVGTCKEIKSNDANHYLAAGCQGYTFANAGEILRDYEGWVSTDFAKFQEWMVTVFASKNLDFITRHSNTVNTHYWANWDLVNMCSYFAIGVLTEDDDMINTIVNYFYTGVGNGCIKRLIVDLHNDPLSTGEEIAQCQESGRDQGHSSMVAAVVAQLCQMAYTLYQDNPTVTDLDFFAADDNAIMKLGEYTALFNLKDGADNNNSTGSWLVAAANMPFTEYTRTYTSGNNTLTETHTVASEDQRGTIRPGWEIIYNHYAHVKGLGSGYTYIQKFAEKLRPEGGAGDDRYGPNSGAFDQLGWGTLMMCQED